MSEEKEKIENLVERVDELLIILNRIVEDLRQVSGSLRSLAVSQITQPSIPPVSYPSSTTEDIAKSSMDDVKMMFPEDLESMLNFEEKDDYIKVKPRQFLGSDNFAKIASIIREIGGDYVSAGKESHFRIPRK